MLQSGKIQIEEPITVVLDEADEMLDMGFLDDIKEIFEFTPDKDGFNLVEKLEKEMDVKSIAIVLASMLLVDDTEEAGPDQIGFTKKRLKQLIEQDRDRFKRNKTSNYRKNKGRFDHRRKKPGNFEVKRKK